ncbi:MAG: tripartite tricarboxylate transporter TctB family protein [Spirochaetia bacterium]
MNEKDMPKADFISSLVLLGFSLSVVVMSINMPRLENREVNPLSVPGIVPGFLGVVIGIFALIMLVRSIRQRGYILEINAEKTRAFFIKDSILRAIGTIALTLVYAWGLVGRLPYLLATFLFVFAFIGIFEYEKNDPPKRKKKKLLIAALMAIISSAIVTAVFRYLFLVSLP